MSSTTEGVRDHTFDEEEDELYRFPGAELDQERPQEGAAVCVVGGGIAGLCAAYELAKVGFQVTVLEATERWGGRIKTQHFANGCYAELGAMRIPIGHGCTREYIKRFGLTERPFVQKNERGLFLIRGEIARACDVKANGKMFRNDPLYSGGRNDLRLSGFPSVTLPSNLQTRNPDQVLEELGRQVASQFSRRAWRAAHGLLNLGSQGTGVVEHCEETELWQYVIGAIDPQAQPAFWGTQPGGNAALSHFYLQRDEWEYFGRLSSHLWLEKISLLQWLLEGGKVTSGNLTKIEGGNSLLVEGFVRRLRRHGAKLQRRATVVAVEVGEGAEREPVRVAWTDRTGSSHSDMFRFAVIAVPAPAAGRIAYTPPLDHDQYEALTNIGYLNLAKAAVACSRRTWEKDPFRIAGGASYTDLPIQQVWYPSDNAVRVSHPAGWYYAPTPSPTGADSTRDYESPFWEPGEPGLSESPGALLTYIWGANARRFAALSDQERIQVVTDGLEQLHPGIRNDIVDVKFATWDGPDLGGGAVAMFSPGEQRRYQSIIARPHPGGKGTARVFFAGEHLAVTHAWIQAAIQTGLAAVLDIFSSPLL